MKVVGELEQRNLVLYIHPAYFDKERSKDKRRMLLEITMNCFIVRQERKALQTDGVTDGQEDGCWNNDEVDEQQKQNPFIFIY